MFLYPPRPTEAIDRSLIPFFETRGYVAQIKKNGTCSVVWIGQSGKVEFYTRHNSAHRAWTPSRQTIEFLSQFRNSCFVFELLHSKGGGVRDTLYFFDALRVAGIDLVGTTFTDRMRFLRGVINEAAPENMSVARVYTKGFKKLYERLTDDLDEGIVLKDPNSVLRDCHRDGLNDGWQVKCRKPTKNYAF